jgi:tRNA1Val (adenine37-N6)-methyltransferase
LKRNILEFSLASKDVEILDFTIEKSPRNYSEQYLQLTKDFHVLENKKALSNF